MSESAELAEYLSDRNFIEGFGAAAAEDYPNIVTLEQQIHGGLMIAKLVGRHGVWRTVSEMAADLQYCAEVAEGRASDAPRNLLDAVDVLLGNDQ